MRRVVGVLVIGLVVAGCGGGGGGEGSGSPPPTEQQAGPPYPVERVEVTLVDPSRPTAEDPARGWPARAERTLETVVLVPEGAGRFPLVVFAHGNGQNADIYAPLVEPLAEAGYVVALPTFPLTSTPSRHSGIPTVFNDYMNQPGDVSFVIGEVLERFADRVDAEHVAVAGHSLGGITTAGFSNSCCGDPRVDAAVPMAAIGLPFPGSYDERPPIPLLVVHGAEDEVVPVAGGDGLFDAATGPAYYLRYTGQSHDGIIFREAEDNASATTLQAVTAFLDATLKGQPEDLAAMADELPADAEWRVRNVP